jgi:hypothetical protein
MNRFRQAENRFLGALKGFPNTGSGVSVDNPIPTRFLAPLDCSKIPAQHIHYILAPWENKITFSNGKIFFTWIEYCT